MNIPNIHSGIIAIDDLARLYLPNDPDATRRFRVILRQHFKSRFRYYHRFYPHEVADIVKEVGHWQAELLTATV